MVKKIICAGTFDILHTGHVEYLKRAKALSLNSELIVIVARDINSEKIKGKKTVNDEEFRLGRISELAFVDKVVLGYEGNRIIEKVVSLNPDIIVLGYDQWTNEEWLKNELEKLGIAVKIFRMLKFKKVIL